MTEIDHDRCSELLVDFLEGKLSEDEQQAVADHLANCEPCNSERAGLASLLEGEPATLTPEERTRLETGVMSAIGESDEGIVVPLKRRATFGSGAARFLGAAAAITVIGTFIYFGVAGSGGDDGAGGSGDTAQTEFDAPVAEEAAGQDAGAGGGTSRTKNKRGAASLGAAADSLRDAPSPTFVVSRDPYTSADLQKLGESSLPSVTFANAYRADDADSSATVLEQLVRLAEQSAGEDVADQVEECAGRVLGSEESILPTFGATGEVNGEAALVVGFAWTSRSRGSLDRYMVWAWEQGNCDVTLDYIEGRIETAN